jgi:hypothetical protein
MSEPRFEMWDNLLEDKEADVHVPSLDRAIKNSPVFCPDLDQSEPDLDEQMAKFVEKLNDFYGTGAQFMPEDERVAKFTKALDEAHSDTKSVAQIRKERPLARGLLDYFPDALLAVANCSYVATGQHHPDAEMHWDKNKSMDEADCIMRHLIDRGKFDHDGVRHSAKVAWRALAMLQRELDG